MTDDTHDEIILHPSRGKWGLIAVVCAFATVCGVLMVVDGAEGGWLVLVASGLGTLVAAVLLIPGAAYLRLNQDGFEYRGPLRRRCCRWDEVTELEAYGPVSYPMVCCNLADPRGVPWYRRLLRPWNPYALWLPDTYGMDAVELAALMNELRAAAIGDVREDDADEPAE